MTSPAIERCDLSVTPELMQKLLVGTAGMPGADFRILTYYVTAAPLGDTVRETAKAIAAQIKLSSGGASKSISRLVAEGWLAPAFKVGAVPFYRAGDRVLHLATAGQPQSEQQLATVSQLPVRDHAANA